MSTRRALLLVDSWAGRRRTPVVVVRETATRYEVAAAEPLALAGRYRRAAPGELVLVPKPAICFIGELEEGRRHRDGR